MRIDSLKSIIMLIVFLIACPAASGEEWDEDKYGPEETIVWTRPVKGTVFEHKMHTIEVGLDCASCHDQDFEMLAGMAEEEDDFTMAAMLEGKYCGNCHYENGFAFSTEKRCSSCHIGVRGVNRLQKAEAGEEEAKKEKH